MRRQRGPTLPDCIVIRGNTGRRGAGQDRGQQPDVEAITRVALKHGLMSKYTAFIGTDSTGPKDANGAPQTIRQPSSAPADVDLAHAGGMMMADAPVMASPASASPEKYDAMAPAEMHRGGGCAGCTTAHTTSGRPAIAALVILGFVVIVRRRRSHRR